MQGARLPAGLWRQGLQRGTKEALPGCGFTNADKIREMDDEALAVAIMCPHDDDKCPGPGDAKTCIKCCLDWLRESAEG